MIFIERAARLAANNSTDFRHRLGAVLFQKKMVIAEGWNKKKTHPMQKRWASKPQRIYLHAEIDAILKGGDLTTGASLAVTRLKKDGTYGCSMPCEGCLAAADEVGIKKIYYINKEGLIDIIELKG